MTQFTQTITESLVILGISPGSDWGTLVWGTDTWGNTLDHITQVEKVLTDSISSSDTWFKVFSLDPITETIAVSSDFTRMVLTDANGYDFLFRGDTTNGNDQINSTYTSMSEGSSTYSATVNPTTTWTDL